MAETTQQKDRGILASFAALLRSRDHINLRNVRLRNLKYMLIFPLAPVFANMQGALFSDSTRLFGLDAMTLMGSAYCVGAGALFALTNQRNMAAVSRACAAWTAASFLPWLVMAESPLSLILAIVFMFGLGGCAACAAFAYTFVLGNAERFFGAAFISLFFALGQLAASFLPGVWNRAYLAALVAGSFACLTGYRAADFSTQEIRPKAALNPALKLMLYFFVAHYFVEIFYTYLPGASSPGAMLANGAVGVFVVCLAVVLQLATRRSVWNMCNLFFVAEICTYLLHFMPQPALQTAARFLHGFEQMGYIAAYYLLGCVFKKHGNMRVFKRCLVVILPASLFTYVVPGVLAAYAPALFPLIAAMISGAVFIVFILLSPAYSKHLFFSEWSDDFYRADMTRAVQAEGAFPGLPDAPALSPREREIAAMLLSGKSAKQIAGVLGITVNTANFHIKNLYRKLRVSSRAELFARFSAPARPAEQ